MRQKGTEHEKAKDCHTKKVEEITNITVLSRDMSPSGRLVDLSFKLPLEWIHSLQHHWREERDAHKHG
jgi:hypothetical protein